MPIVDGRYEARIGTRFKRVEDGIEEIRSRIRRSRGIRIRRPAVPNSTTNQMFDSDTHNAETF